MKSPLCRELEAWIDGLPETEMSAELISHLENCRECSLMLDRLLPAVRLLIKEPAPEKLSEPRLRSFVARAQQENLRRTKQRAAARMGLHILLGLPIVIFTNWWWVSKGSSWLAALISLEISHAMTVIFLLGSSLMLSLIFGSLPLLWNRQFPAFPKESTK